MKLDELLDLCRYLDLSSEYKILMKVGDDLKNVSYAEIDRENNQLIFHDTEEEYIISIQQCCDTCALFIKGICEYYNVAKEKTDCCSEWLFCKE